MEKNKEKMMQIKEFSEKTGLSPYTIRFYEKKELFRVKRDEKIEEYTMKRTLNG